MRWTEGPFDGWGQSVLRQQSSWRILRMPSRRRELFNVCIVVQENQTFEMSDGCHRNVSQMLPLPRQWISSVSSHAPKPFAHLHENIYKLSMEVNPPSDPLLLFYIISLWCSKNSSYDFVMKVYFVWPTHFSSSFYMCFCFQYWFSMFVLQSRISRSHISDSKWKTSYSCNAFWYILSNCGC